MQSGHHSFDEITLFALLWCERQRIRSHASPSYQRQCNIALSVNGDLHSEELFLFLGPFLHPILNPGAIPVAFLGPLSGSLSCAARKEVRRMQRLHLLQRQRSEDC